MRVESTEALAAIGLSENAPLSEVVARLEEILDSAYDHRRDHAMDLLSAVQPTKSDLRMRVDLLRGRHVERSRDDASERFRKLVHPEDDLWRQELRTIVAAANAQAQATEFVQILVKRFENHLSHAQDARRTEFLIRHKPLFSECIAGLEPRMLPSDRIKLKSWIAEGTEFELSRLVEHAQTASTGDAWDAVEQCADELTRLLQSQQQKVEAGKARDEVQRFRRWRKRFNSLLETLDAYEFDGRARFPWSSIDIEERRLESIVTIKQIEETLSGLETFGGDADRVTWEQALERVSRAAITGICTAAEKTCGESLLCIKELRSQWLDQLGSLPFSADWDEQEGALRRRIEAQIVEWVAGFRASFNDEASLKQAVEMHPELSRLRGIESDALCGFREEVRRLSEISSSLTAWQQDGDTLVLHDQRLKNLEDDLHGLAEGWGSSPGYVRYREQMDALQQELATLDQAEKLIAAGNSGAALDRLEGCTSNAAERLKLEARQAGRDDRIRIAIRQGEYHTVTPQDLDRASEQVQQAYRRSRRGHEFIEALHQRIQTCDRHSDFSHFAQYLLALASEEPPGDADLTEIDATRLAGIRKDIHRRVSEQAGQEIADLERRFSLFPLPQQSTLDALDAQAQALEAGLGLKELHPTDVNLYAPRLKPIQLGLRVHRACTVSDWIKAEQELERADTQDHLGWDGLRQLWATLRSERLRRTRAGDDEWLALYRDLADVLMQPQHPEPRARYLRLLRTMSAVPEPVDAEIVEREFPEEGYLASLLNCFQDASLVEEIEGLPRFEDEPVLAHLLRHLCKSTYNYFPIRRLWTLLPDDVRSRVWSGPDTTPVDYVAGLLNAEHERIAKQLADPEISVASLRQGLEEILKTNLIDERTTTMLDVAADIERAIHELDRRDPWDAGLRHELGVIQSKLGRLTPAIRSARDWPRAVDRRHVGIAAWEDVEAAWLSFSGRFARLTALHTETRPWSGFIDLLRHWIESIEHALPQIDWDLPRAEQSRRWTGLLDAWSRSEEGRLWIAADRPPPTDLQIMCDQYRTIQTQIEEFESLHAKLLAQTKPELLEQLHQIIPLSRPINEIKRQLTNPDVALFIGPAYQRFLDTRTPT